MGIYEKNNCRILGKGQWISNDDIKSGLNNNDLIIGGTGSGKTGGYVIPNIRQANGNMVITDTKSILYKKLGKELEKQGYDVSILDFVNPERSDTYNPLEYIRTVNHFGLADYNHKDIISLSRVLVPTRIKHDPFWEESARTVMAFLIAFTLEALREEDHCMSSIVELYRQLGMENGKKRFEVWCMEHPNSFAAKKYAMFCGVMNVDRTWGCISQFLAEALEPFDFREMEYIFGRTGAGKKINLSDLWEKKKVIFLNISDTDRYADRVANLFYTQALQVLCAEADLRNEGRLPRPVRFILDDFAANVYIEDFDKLISVIRSRNISVSVILQSLTQLQSMYSKEQADTIVTNCDHLLYLGGQDTFQGKIAEYVVYYCLRQYGFEVEKPDLGVFGENIWDNVDIDCNGRHISIKSTKERGQLLLLEKGDWNDQGCYIPNINDGGKMAQYDYHMLVRVRPSCEDILRNNRILYGSELPEEVIDILLNQSWEYCMPRYISRDELIYLIQNNFVIKAGSYFNKTKMDADNYYVKAYDMHELPEIINGLS